MAVARAPSAALMLFGARAREAWNGLRRDTGLAGHAFAALALLLACVALVAPFLACVGLGRGVVGALASAAAPGAEILLGGLHAAIVLALGALGGLRSAPHYHPSLIATFPIGPVAHGIAELLPGLLQPAALAAIACTLGLAVGAATHGVPLVPVALLLAFQTLLGLLLVTGAVRLAVAAWRERRAFRYGAVAATALAALAWTAAAPDGVEAARAALRVLPSTHGVLALGDVVRGDKAYGLGRALAAVVPVVLLAPLVATRLAATARRLRGGPPAAARELGSFAGPVRAVASVFFAQVWRTRRGRTLMLAPALLTALAVVLVWFAQHEPKLAPEPAVRALFATTPWLAWTAVAIALFVDQELWINQFGWDRRGLTGLLLLPVDAESLVRGKLLGFAAIVAAQCAFALPPLLLVHAPAATELAAIVTHASVAVLAAGTIGLDFSLRRPRPVPVDTTANTLPWSLALVPPAVAALVFGAIGCAGLLGRAVFRGVPGADVIGAGALALVAAWLVRVELPRLAVLLARRTERLVVDVA